jgi:hypothetical protein
MPLKEQCQEIFEIFSFHDSSSPGLPLIPSAPFRFFLSKICENIRKSRFTADVVDAVSLTPAANVQQVPTTQENLLLASRRPSIQ